jgi:hypothetical protein
MTITADVQPKNTNDLPPHLRAVFALRSQKLQMLPAVAVKALAIARDPDCSIREFVSVVERDTKLASDILSMANSPLFFTGGLQSSASSSLCRGWDFCSVATGFSSPACRPC